MDQCIGVTCVYNGHTIYIYIYVVTTRQSNPLISKVSSPCHEFTRVSFLYFLLYFYIRIVLYVHCLQGTSIMGNCFLGSIESNVLKRVSVTRSRHVLYLSVPRSRHVLYIFVPRSRNDLYLLPCCRNVIK